MSHFTKFEKTAALYNQLSEMGKNPFTVVMEDVLGPTRAMIKGRETVLAGTHNYLGQTFEPKAIAAAKKALDEEGTGTTGSRFANGTFAGHKQLERDIADFLGLKHCVIFSTGFVANLGAIAGLIDPSEDVILVDADCHACIYDGCSLSGAGTINVLSGAVLEVAAFDVTNIQSGTVNLPAGSRLSVTSNTISVASGVTVIKDGAFGPSGDALSALTASGGRR